jgi:cell shape-determining protein MreC
MTMNSFLRHYNNERGGYGHALKIIFLVIITVIAIQLAFPEILPKPLHFIGNSLWRIKNTAYMKAGSMSSLLRSKKSLVLENNSLKQRLLDMREDILTFRLISQENKELKALAGMNAEKKTVLAVVLARPNVSPYDTFVIGIGSGAGIEKGNQVFVSDDIVIGAVEAVYRNTSVVKLFSAPGEKTAVAIGPENVPAEAVGRGGGNFLTRIPRGIGIEEGYFITMPGINQKVFGIVEVIEDESADPFATIFFKNPVNVSEVKWVQVEI